MIFDDADFTDSIKKKIMKPKVSTPKSPGKDNSLSSKTFRTRSFTSKTPVSVLYI